jgi:DNA polymerase-1
VHGIRFPLRIGGKVVWYFPVLHPAYVLRMGGERSAVAPIFKADIKTFFANVDRWRPARIADLALDQVQIMRDRAPAEAALARMQRPLAVDLETSKLRPFHRDAKILTAAFSDGDTTIAFPIEHEQAKSCTWGRKLLLDTISSTPWIAHNAAFELLWFWAAAEAASDDWRPGSFDDTMALGRLYHERETLLSLDDLSRVHLGVAVKELSPVDPRKIENFPLDEVLRYCGLDALASALLYRQLHKQVDRDNYQRILASIVSTVAMERAGLPIDPEASERLRQDWTARKQEVAAEAGRIYEVREFERHMQKPFSISNPNDVGQALAVYGRVPLPKTGSGKWSTDDAILEKQCKDHPLVSCVHRYREAAKIISTYIEPVTKARQDNADGQLHPGYTTMLTATGRLSSHEPNIQNFPRRRHKEVRRQIVAPDRHLMLAFDYGQLEARVIAMASRDQQLCDAIMHGYDVHQHWLDRLLKLYPTYLQTIAERTGKRDPAAVRKAARDAIKTDFVFSSFFGSAPKNCAANIGAPLEIVQQLAEEFWLEFRGVRNWLKARHREYRDTGAIRTLTGRVRRALLWGNEPINTPIQGTAADIVVDAMNAMTETALRQRDRYLLPRMQIHDDLTFILPDDADLPRYIESISACLVAVRFDWQIVPLTVEAKIGTNWAELEEFAVFTGGYRR